MLVVLVKISSSTELSIGASGLLKPSSTTSASNKVVVLPFETSVSATDLAIDTVGQIEKSKNKKACIA